MNCNEVQAQLSAYLDGNSKQAASSELKQHLANCVKCGDALQQELALRAMLREMRVPQPSEDFVSRSFQAAFSQQRVKPTEKQSAEIKPMEKQIVEKGQPSAFSPKGEKHHSIMHGFVWGFSSAAAVALMIWGVTAAMLVTPKEETLATTLASTQGASVTTHAQAMVNTIAKASTDVPVVKIKLNGIQPIKLAFNAPRAVEHATISITLPDHVSLEGFPGERTIEWETSLAAGDNTLSLPILGKQLHSEQATDFLVAKVSHKGGEQSLSLRLQVVNPGMSLYPLPSRDRA